MNKEKASLKNSLMGLEKWIQNNGWAGYDPYDIKGEVAYGKLAGNKYIGAIMDQAISLSGNIARKFFDVKPTTNPKAMALFSRAYFSMYRTFGNKEYLENGKYCLRWLKENPSQGYSGLCWGYPFDWKSRIFIPKFTPSTVVSSIASHAFLDAYELLSDDEYLDVATSICNFISKDIAQDRVSDDEICFSYTPIDKFHVHNANMFSASTLLRCSGHTGNRETRELGTRALNFVARAQNKDGSWYYWAPPDKVEKKVDNYHTGFVLECMSICKDSLGDDFEYNMELTKGIDFYASNLFFTNGAPKLMLNNNYPIDIHSCAQGIITFSEITPKRLDIALGVAKWTIENMQDGGGYFYYRQYENKRIDKTPYIRWGQAWMLLALARMLEVKNSGGEANT